MAAKITVAGAAVARRKAKIAAIKAEIDKANAKMDAVEAKVYARITVLKAENQTLAAKVAVEEAAATKPKDDMQASIFIPEEPVSSASV